MQAPSIAAFHPASGCRRLSREHEAVPHERTRAGDAAVEIVPYDPSWPTKFAEESVLISSALAPWIVGGLEHIGSTAVPGLAAKPIIDIMAPVETLALSSPAIEVAASLGYHYFPYKAEAMHWFCKPSPSARSHHLHLVPLNSGLWHDRLTFRNALRSKPELRNRYQALKLRVAQAQRNDREAYTEAKGSFIADVLARVDS